MTDYARLLRALASAGVEFVVVGEAAATTHGAARLTLDLDVVYRRTDSIASCKSSVPQAARRTSKRSPSSKRSATSA